MSKFSTKITGNQVTASEYNDVTQALKNSIEDSGQSIDATNIQTSKSMSNNAAVATFYTENGVADVYNLIVIDGFRGLTKLIDGAQARFRAANGNTGPSTINVAGTGVRDIKLEDGISDIGAGNISSVSDTFIRYDLSNNVWLLLPIGSLATSILVGNSLLPQKITIANSAGDSANDIDFSAGNFIFDDGSGQSSVLALTKQIDATFVAGDNQGGLDTGSVASNTTYHFFAIHNPATQASDFLFSTSLASPTLPSGFTKKRRVASIKTNGSSEIHGFIQVGNKFLYLAQKIDRASAALNGTVLVTLSVPAGIQVLASVVAKLSTNNNASDRFSIINDPASTTLTASSSNYTEGIGGTSTSFTYERTTILGCVRTDTLGRVNAATSANMNLELKTLGYEDFSL